MSLIDGDDEGPVLSLFEMYIFIGHMIPFYQLSVCFVLPTQLYHPCLLGMYDDTSNLFPSPDARPLDSQM